MIPDAPGYQLASLDPRALDATEPAPRAADPFYDPFAERTRPPAPRYTFPSVDRSRKGDLLIPRDRLPVAGQEAPPAAKEIVTEPVKTQERAATPESVRTQEPAKTKAQAIAPAALKDELIPAREPFEISQKLIAEAARIDARRRAAAEKAERAKKNAFVMPKAGKAEPFAISAQAIAEAERIEAARDAAATSAAEVKVEPSAETTVDAQADMQAEIQPRLAMREAELPHAVMPEEMTSDVAAPGIAASETAVPEIPPDVIADVSPNIATAQVEMPDFSGWAGPFAEAFAVPQDLIDEVERIALARATPQETPDIPAAVAAMQADVAREDAARADEEATEAGTGIPVVENDKVVTDEEPRDEESDIAATRPENPAMQAARLYFGADAFGETPESLEAYAPGEAPTVEQPAKIDPDIKLSALPDGVQDDPKIGRAPAKAGGKDMSKDASKDSVANETIAPKGEVTGPGQRPRTPAERLGLTGASRAKQERCLANAIYFESRGEPERGQMAVAQVVMNRVFSPYYPASVCGVVYQNAHKHNACQFTFACDNVRDVVTEPEAWEVAKRISRDTLDGKIWLPEIAKATHYHATYVSPWWKRTMHKYKTLGVHIFYRPTRWGDGSDEPTWDPVQVEATGSIKAPDKSRSTAFNK
jgi:spore germination cell wall hydrolase CwlJ-like protein